MVARPVAGVTHDVVLAANADGSGAQAGLILVRNEEDRLIQRALVPTRPAEFLKVGQESWHQGFGDFLFNPNDPYRYAYSNGIDLRFANRAQLASKLDSQGVSIGLGATDGGFEDNIDDWHRDTRVGAAISTLTRSSTRSYVGDYSLRAYDGSVDLTTGDHWVFAYKVGLASTLGIADGDQIPIQFRMYRDSGEIASVQVAAILYGNTNPNSGTDSARFFADYFPTEAKERLDLTEDEWVRGRMVITVGNARGTTQMAPYLYIVFAVSTSGLGGGEWLAVDTVGDELWLIDRDTPANSTLIGALPATFTSPYSLGYGNGEWLATDDAGNALWLIDRVTPSNSSIIGTLPNGLSEPQGLGYGDGEWLCMDSSADDLWLIDRATPSNSIEIGSLPNGLSHPHTLAYGNGEWLAINNAGDALWLIDRVTPSNSSIIGVIGSGHGEFRGLAYGNGEWLVTEATGDRLWLIDRDTPSNSSIIGKLPSGLTVPQGLGFGGVTEGLDISNAAYTLYLDQFSIGPTGEGAKTMVLYKDHLYYGIGPNVYKLNTATDDFEIIKAFTGYLIKDVAVHSDYLVSVLSDNNAVAHRYAYWDGEADDWTTVNLTFLPDFVESVIDHNGQSRMVLAKQTNDIYFNESEDVDDVPDQNLKVGHTSHPITQIHKAFDSTIIGKTDGLYYSRVKRGLNWAPDNVFAPATTSRFEDEQNYRIATEFSDGWFYFSSASFGMERLQFNSQDRVILETVNPSFSAPEYRAYGGHIVGLISDGYYLYALQDYEDSQRNHFLQILSGSHERSFDGKELVWHTLYSQPFNPPILSAFLDQMAHRILVVHGSPIQVLTLSLPRADRNPANEPEPSLSASGTMVTPIFDYGAEGWANDDKRFVELYYSLHVPESDWAFEASYQIDDDIEEGGAWTQLGRSVTEDSHGRLVFPPRTTGQRIRFRFTLSSSDSTLTPQLRRFELSALPMPIQRQTWDMTAQIGGALLLGGSRDTRRPEDIIKDLDTIAAQGTGWLFHEKGADPVEVVIQNSVVEWQQSYLNPETEQREAQRRRVARLQLTEV